MRYEIIVLESAKDQITEIGDYIRYSIGNSFAARNVIRKIDAAILSLAVMPHRNPIKDNLFRIHIKHFTIFYRIVGNTVIVISVIYSCRMR